MPDLIAVGYWCTAESKELPDPRALAGESYPPALLDGISRYLLGGEVFMSWFGFSYCRFECGVNVTDMGSADFTDGVWVWPHGLHHYVHHHKIRLPEEFIQTMRESQWRVWGPLPPQGLDMRPDGSLHFPITYDFWIDWAHQRGGA